MSKPVAAPHTLLIKHPASLTGCQVEIALCLAGADNKVVKRAHPAHVNTLLGTFLSTSFRLLSSQHDLPDNMILRVSI
jgi:hypothetical protein